MNLGINGEKSQKIELDHKLLDDKINQIMEYKRSSAVEIRNYTFYYEHSPKPILDSINLNIEEGALVFIGGPSGSGKSTLLKSIIGYIVNNVKGKMKGDIQIFNKSIMEYHQIELSKLFGVVFQNPDEQLVTFSVFDEIAFALENLCLNPESIKQMVNEIANKLKITHLLERNISSLSGGEKQKVVIAAALIKKPRILIFDEPLAFLDHESEKRFIELLQSIKNSYEKISIIIVEHRLYPFIQIIDELFLLDNLGKIKTIKPNEYYQTVVEPKPNNHQENEIIKSKNQDIAFNKPATESNHIPLIEIKNLNFSYENHTIFSNFNLEIKKKEILGIIGDNGIGKTTLMYLITKILTPESGEIVYNQKNIWDYDDMEFYPKIGYIFQNPETQIFETTIKDELLFGPRNFGMIPEKQQPDSDKVKQILFAYSALISESRIPIEEIQRINPFRLSWGQKRRVNFGSVLSYNPDLLLLDEPFIGQDTKIVREIFDIIMDLQRKGITIVIISHDIQYLTTYCDRIIDLNQQAKIEHTEEKKEKKHEDYILKEDITSHDSIEDKKRQKRRMRKLKSLKNIIVNDNLDKSPNIIYSINPNVKMFFIICLTISIFIQSRIENLVFFISVPLFLVILAKISIKEFIRKLKWILWLSIVFIFLNAIFDAQIHPNDEIFFVFFGLHLRKIAFFYALRTGVITITLFSTSLIFSKTTPIKHVIYGFIQLGMSYRYAFSLMIGLRYVPMIEQESSLIETAQRLRGLGINAKSKPNKVFKHVFHRISILLINIMRKTTTTAIALEFRNFGLFQKRTNLFAVQFRKIDYISVIISIIILILSLMSPLNLLIFN